MGQQRVAIVGCGIIGACCAYYLRKAGWQTTMIDQAAFGQACSHGNCGLISPSHALPLAMPGVIRKTLPMIFKKSAPIRIKPRLDPTLWSWLYKFAARCKTEPMLEAAWGRHALLQSSFELYRELIDSEGIECEWEHQGCLLVYRDSAGMEKHQQIDTVLAEFGLGADRLGGDELVELEPALKRDLAGAWLYKMDAHLRPDRLMAGLRRKLEDEHVTIHESRKFLGFSYRGKDIAAIDTDAGPIEADTFVVATGSWTPMLNKWLGTKIPIQPGKGYSMTMPRPRKCPTIPLLLQERKVAVTPMQTGYRLGSTMEFAGYDTTLDPVRLQALRDGAADYLLEPHCEPIEERWYGWRPMTYDGLPIIDRSPSASNVYIAAGHNMLGLSMGSATGKLISELISGSEPHIEPTPYSVMRFR